MGLTITFVWHDRIVHVNGSDVVHYTTLFPHIIQNFLSPITLDTYVKPLKQLRYSSRSPSCIQLTAVVSMQRELYVAGIFINGFG